MNDGNPTPKTTNVRVERKEFLQLRKLRLEILLECDLKVTYNEIIREFINQTDLEEFKAHLIKKYSK